MNSTWGVSWHATAIPSIKKRIEKRKLVFRVEFIDIRAKFVFFLLLSILVSSIDPRHSFVRRCILFIGIRVVRIRGIEERVDFRSVFRLARLIAISKRTRLRKCTLHRFPHFRSLFTRLPTRRFPTLCSVPRLSESILQRPLCGHIQPDRSAPSCIMLRSALSRVILGA